MCGIVGLISLDKNSEKPFERFSKSSELLNHRGPDATQTIIEKPIALGHTRLSIIDLDSRSNQPMTDESGRYTLVFNGEIYNFEILKQECVNAGYSFKTNSDTEVLLVLYMLHGKKCLTKLNGFFAFGIYDRKEEHLFVARDRYGIKPLLYYKNQGQFAFSSELKALTELGFTKELDKVSIFTFFKLNYIPAPETVYKNFHKLEPGSSLSISWKENELEIEHEKWYELSLKSDDEKMLTAHDYKESKKVLKRFMRESVRRRLVADVSVGTFLSGGIDSSIISAIAKEEKDDIESFSIGFPDHPYFDESSYAEQVAKYIGTKHHKIDVSEKELLESADQILNHLDEPFGDSSILNVNVLSKKVRKHASVALSGDGGDELFGGYNKHSAEFLIRNPKFREHLIGNLGFLWQRIPASRSGKWSNFSRQLLKFSEGYAMSHRDRYWRWAGILNEEQANYLMKEEMLDKEHRLSDEAFAYKKRKDALLKHITKTGTLNEVLISDVHMVLPNDMLFKVDHASMMHGLEVRTPMLDQNIVKFAFRLPVMFKVNHTTKKKILSETFADMLPSQVFERKKRGFEVPLEAWLNGSLKSDFIKLANDEDFLIDQGLFNPAAIKEKTRVLYSSNPGDSASWAWSFMVFQNWYKRNM